MIYLLDTNTCIRFLDGRSPAVRLRLQQEQPQDMAVCSVVKAELFFGAMSSNNPMKNLAVQQRFLQTFASFPFDDDAAKVYGRIRADLKKKGTPIGANDFMIASIAIVNNLILVTHNIREFSRVQGLLLEDWESGK